MAWSVVNSELIVIGTSSLSMDSINSDHLSHGQPQDKLAYSMALNSFLIYISLSTLGNSNSA